jgi:hypothetical protein
VSGALSVLHAERLLLPGLVNQTLVVGVLGVAIGVGGARESGSSGVGVGVGTVLYGRLDGLLWALAG